MADITVGCCSSSTIKNYISTSTTHIVGKVVRVVHGFHDRFPPSKSDVSLTTWSCEINAKY